MSTSSTAPVTTSSIGAPASHGPMSALDIHRTEYSELKDEQRTRLAIRDNLGYATWAAIGLVLAAGRVTNQALSPQWWLALPLVVGVLGWTRFQNDVKISGIGRYIQADLAPKVAAMVGEPVFGWESALRAPSAGRKLRQAGQLAADLALYAAVPAVALGAFWASSSTGWIWTASATAEALGITVLASMITSHSSPRLPSAAPAETNQRDG